MDLNRDGVHFTDLAHAIHFDLDADGSKEQITWASPQDGTLVMDLDHSGAIEDGTRSSPTTSADLNLTRRRGDASLAPTSMASSRASDERFIDLRAWVDANNDGLSQAGELFSFEPTGHHVNCRRWNSRGSDD